jgi:hypothetical protein
LYGHRSSRLKEADGCAGRDRWRIRVEPDVVQCTPTDGVRVLVLSEGLAAEHYSGIIKISCPWCAAIAGVVRRTVERISRLLRRSMKGHIAERDSGPSRQDERLNTAIEVLVVQSILIMPNTLRGVCHLVCNVRKAIAR